MDDKPQNTQPAAPRPSEPETVRNWLDDLDQDARESFLHAVEKGD